MAKRVIVDLDGTLALPQDQSAGASNYASAVPNLALISKLRIYQNCGFEIVIHTARNMRTYNGAIGKIALHTLPVILEWLKTHNVPHDEVIIGKPWCGTDGFYVDDRAVRPSEFIALEHSEILGLMKV